MRLRGLAAIVVGSLVLCAPVRAAGGEFEAVLQAKDPQRASKLDAKASCEGRCHVTLRGNAKTEGEKFKLRPRERTLPTGEKERFKLEIRKRRALEELLADENGVATVRLRAVDPKGAVAKAKLKLTLTG